MRIDDEVSVRTGKNSQVYCRLGRNVWERMESDLRVVNAYKAVVLLTFIYACKTSAVYQCYTKRFKYVMTIIYLNDKNTLQSFIY